MAPYCKATTSATAASATTTVVTASGSSFGLEFHMDGVTGCYSAEGVGPSVCHDRAVNGELINLVTRIRCDGEGLVVAFCHSGWA